MDEGDAIFLEQVADLAEEFAVVADAHVLEHADRDDAVEGRVHVPVVLQAEVDPALQPPLADAGAGGRRLLLGEGDAGDLRPPHLREVEAEPAPARADVEHLEIGLVEQELGREVALLGELGVVEA